MWVIFGVAVAAAIIIDLGFFRRRAEPISVGAAALETVAWVVLSLDFSLFVYLSKGPEAGLQFLAGYVVEKSLSVDNIFIFAMIFRAFGVPSELQHRVLYSGVIGALVMRAIFVAAGIQLLRHFRPVLFLFGAVLLLTGLRMLYSGVREVQPGRNWFVKCVRQIVPVTDRFHADKFVVKEGTEWSATPLFLALIAVEAMDIIFAVDSVPAVLAITRDSFIAYSSNVFAILGLRAMYFGVAGALQRLRFLHAGLAAILVFVGVKMVIAEKWPISTTAALLVISSILALTAIISLLRPDSRTAATRDP